MMMVGDSMLISIWRSTSKPSLYGRSCGPFPIPTPCRSFFHLPQKNPQKTKKVFGSDIDFYNIEIIRWRKKQSKMVEVAVAWAFAGIWGRKNLHYLFKNRFQKANPRFKNANPGFKRLKLSLRRHKLVFRRQIPAFRRLILGFRRPILALQRLSSGLRSVKLSFRWPILYVPLANLQIPFANPNIPFSNSNISFSNPNIRLEPQYPTCQLPTFTCIATGNNWGDFRWRAFLKIIYRYYAGHAELGTVQAMLC